MDRRERGMGWLRDVLERFRWPVPYWLGGCIRPTYEPSAWNDANGIQYKNNCYNYACDMQTGTYAQPGQASGYTYHWAAMLCQEVRDAAVSDGLVPVDCDSGCGPSECSHQVALVIRPGIEEGDFHWYRKDRDGRWSHKLGGSPATNLDNSKNIITDPRTADRGSYTDFCGCYCVDKTKVKIK